MNDSSHNVQVSGNGAVTSAEQMMIAKTVTRAGSESSAKSSKLADIAKNCRAHAPEELK
jgi:hypothetical protein